MMMLFTIFFTNLLFLYFVYDGYLRVLLLIAASRHFEVRPTSRNNYPLISVLLTVHDEAEQIKDRLKNILNSTYPIDKIDVLVASDGSTDGTDEIVKSFGDERVRVFRPAQRKGKTETQNLAIRDARGEIIIFTDADTRFHKDFLLKITAPFSDGRVGAVDGHLLFGIDVESGIARSQGYYWRYELQLRRLESQLGILAVASGACLAVRKELLKEMEPTTGEDCIVPLDVVQQGYKVVHAEGAIAYDQMDRNGEKEFRTRVRMTLRNWQGTWSRVGLLNPLAYPGYAFALWSHKVLRWLSPFFLIGFTLSALSGALQGEVVLQIVTFGLFVFYVAVTLGWWCERKGRHFPLVHVPYSFILANTGFMVGVLKALVGRRIYTYR